MVVNEQIMKTIKVNLTHCQPWKSVIFTIELYVPKLKFTIEFGETSNNDVDAVVHGGRVQID